jgi:hypothetical protein
VGVDREKNIMDLWMGSEIGVGRVKKSNLLIARPRQHNVYKQMRRGTIIWSLLIPQVSGPRGVGLWRKDGKTERERKSIDELGRSTMAEISPTFLHTAHRDFPP